MTPVSEGSSITVCVLSGGRFDLGIGVGWMREEFEALGLSTYDRRGAATDEQLRILKTVWTQDVSSFEGEFYSFDRLGALPHPLQKPYPVIMNAGTSPAGRSFAAKHSDLIFSGLQNIETAPRQIAEIKQLAREDHGREIRVFGRGHVVCRDTEKEAEEYYDYVHRQVADLAGAANVTGMSRANSQSTDWSVDERKILEGMIAGFWGIPMVGTPEQVARKMIALHEAGADGIALSWVNFDEGLDQMETQILPMLVEAGLRSPVNSTEAPEPATRRR